jgi:hypothetical protein
MAATGLSLDFSQINLSSRDASVLFRLAYFPRVRRERRLAMLNEAGVTEAGKRIGRALLDQDESELSAVERVVLQRYRSAAQHDRLGPRRRPASV